MIHREGNCHGYTRAGKESFGEKKCQGSTGEGRSVTAKRVLSYKYRSFGLRGRMSEGVDYRWLGDFSSNKYFLIRSLLYSID
jgi:hypothetical protein